MTVTTTTLTARRAEATGIGRPMLLGRALGAERTKLRSVRSTYASLLAAVVVTVGIAALAAWAIITDDQPNPATATQLAAVGASVGQFGLVALAALADPGCPGVQRHRRDRHGLPARRAEHGAGQRHRRALQPRGGGRGARRLGRRGPDRRGDCPASPRP
jgi:hypothetical protein